MKKQIIGASIVTESGGTAILELTLTLPIILLIFVSTLDFGLILKEENKAAGIARELANVSLRRCAYNADPSICASGIINRYIDLFERELSGGTVSIKIFTKEGERVNFTAGASYGFDNGAIVSALQGESVLDKLDDTAIETAPGPNWDPPYTIPDEDEVPIGGQLAVLTADVGYPHANSPAGNLPPQPSLRRAQVQSKDWNFGSMFPEGDLDLDDFKNSYFNGLNKFTQCVAVVEVGVPVKLLGADLFGIFSSRFGLGDHWVYSISVF